MFSCAKAYTIPLTPEDDDLLPYICLLRATLTTFEQENPN
jgi:hypothetical protein